jgi:hypothetical protein
MLRSFLLMSPTMLMMGVMMQVVFGKVETRESLPLNTKEYQIVYWNEEK